MEIFRLINNDHWLLMILWLGYCIVHSVLADVGIKIYIQKVMGSAFKFYRPIYSFFSLVTLVFLLWFQFSIQSLLLFKSIIYLYIAAALLGLTGLGIMIMCISKYFYELSGLQAIQHSQAKNTLQQSGLHRYVRHPLYFGTLLFVWSLFFVLPSLSNLIAAIIITLYTLLGIRLEEKKLMLEYGDSYIDYIKRVPMLIPGLKL